MTEVGTGSTLAADPGSDGGLDLLLTSLDGGTLFVSGPNGVLVLPAP